MRWEQLAIVALWVYAKAAQAGFVGRRRPPVAAAVFWW